MPTLDESIIAVYEATHTSPIPAKTQASLTVLRAKLDALKQNPSSDSAAFTQYPQKVAALESKISALTKPGTEMDAAAMYNALTAFQKSEIIHGFMGQLRQPLNHIQARIQQAEHGIDLGDSSIKLNDIDTLIQRISILPKDNYMQLTLLKPTIDQLGKLLQSNMRTLNIDSLKQIEPKLQPLVAGTTPLPRPSAIRRPSTGDTSLLDQHGNAGTGEPHSPHSPQLLRYEQRCQLQPLS